MRARKVIFKFDAGTNKVTADDVVRAMRLILGATGELQDWQIQSLRLASPLQIIATCSEETYAPIHSFVKLMRKIESTEAPTARLIATDAKLLDSVERMTQTSFRSLQISPSLRLTVTLNQALIQKARHVTGQLVPSLMIHAREQLGQLRGYLERVIVRKDEAARFGIRDRVSGALILCSIAEGDRVLFNQARDALGRRVIVSGLIRFGELSRPTSIKVAEIELPEEFTIPFDQLPRAPLTYDGDSVRLIRGLRDG